METKRGYKQLCVEGYTFTKDKTRKNTSFWSCTQAKVFSCTARASSIAMIQKKGIFREKVILRGNHNHAIVTERRKPGARAQLIKNLHRNKLKD